MKEKELRDSAVCAICGNKIGASGLPLFYRVTVKRFGIDMRALQRQQGLTMFMGSPVLASAMGPDEDLANEIMSETITVCELCSDNKIIHKALEHAADSESTQEQSEA